MKMKTKPREAKQDFCFTKSIVCLVEEALIFLIKK